MTDRISDLLGIIREEINLYRDLVEQARRKTSLLVQGSVEAIQESNRIEEAFNSVWRTLYAQVTSDNRQSEELRIQLSQTLVALASDGITDPRELRRKAPESIAFSLR